jgi:hypothetical protein
MSKYVFVKTITATRPELKTRRTNDGMNDLHGRAGKTAAGDRDRKDKSYRHCDPYSSEKLLNGVYAQPLAVDVEERLRAQQGSRFLGFRRQCRSPLGRRGARVLPDIA